MKAKDLIYRGFRIAQILANAGRGFDDLINNDGLLALNSMLDNWAIEKLLVWSWLRSVQTVKAGQQVYTIGPGAADYNMPRPSKIEKANILSLNNPAQPLELPMQILSVDEWQAIPVKNIQSTLPLNLYYDSANPIGNIYLYMVPSQNTQMALYLWQTLQQFASTESDVVLAPGYQAAIEYNLAIELAAIFPRANLTPLAIARAAEYKAAVKRLNLTATVSTCDPAILSTHNGHYNFYSDK